MRVSLLSMLPLLDLRVDGVNVGLGRGIDVGEPRLEVLDVASDRKKAEDPETLDLGAAVPLAVLGNHPFALVENADEVTGSHVWLLLIPR